MAGHPPFAEGTALKTIMAHIEKEPAPIDEARPETPAALSAVVARMLAKSPVQRYQAPAEVAAALAPFCEAKPKSQPATTKANVLPLSSPERTTASSADTSPILIPRHASAGPTGPIQGSVPPGPTVTCAVSERGAVPPLPSKEMSPAGPPMPGRRRRRTMFMAGGVTAVLAALALGAWLVAGVVFKVKTPEGLLVVEVDHPGAEIFVDGNRWEMDVPGDKEPIRIELPLGEHELKVAKGGFEAVTRKLTLAAGKPERISIALVADASATQPGASEQRGTDRAASPAPKPGEIRTFALGMKFAWIPPGDFQMGSPPGEEGHNENERQHHVTLTKGFWMGVDPVTRGQFASFVKAVHYRTEAERPAGSAYWAGNGYEGDSKLNWQNPGFDQTDEHPRIPHWYASGSGGRWGIQCRGAIAPPEATLARDDF